MGAFPKTPVTARKYGAELGGATVEEIACVKGYVRIKYVEKFLCEMWKCVRMT